MIRIFPILVSRNKAHYVFENEMRSQFTIFHHIFEVLSVGIQIAFHFSRGSVVCKGKDIRLINRALSVRKLLEFII